MPSFQQKFLAAEGKPIEYEGKKLQLVDYFSIDGAKGLRLQFEKINSEWRQGVAIDVVGDLIVNDQRIRKSLVLWEDTAPVTVDIEIVGSITYATIYNVWDMGRGTTDAWHNGAAMIVHDISNGKQYQCNDGHPDDNFDDLVFRVTRIGETL